jgi:hypothetical protein
MALKLSTKMRNALLSGEDVRRLFEDAVIKIWSGSSPSTANDAATGTLLVTISKASGTVSTGEVSTAKQAKLQITSHASGETFTVTINGTTYTYTNTPDAGDATAVAAAVALMLDSSCPDVSAMAAGTDTIYIRSNYKGVTFTITKGGTGTSTLSDDAVANVTADTIRLAAASSGSISKASEVWSGVAVASGTAGYFRIQTSADDDTNDASNLLFPRLQGSVGVSGTEMTMSSTTIASGATQTIDSATITMPAS